MIAGIILLFFGRRTFRGILFFAGFMLGSLIAYIILVNVEPFTAEGVSQWGDRRDAIYFGVCIASGILIGIMSSCFFRLGLFAVGAFGGFTLSMWILSWSSSSLIPNDAARYVFIAVLALIGGILALFFEHHVIIISTSIGGAYLVIFGIDCFTRLGFAGAVSLMFQGNSAQYVINSGSLYALLVSALVLAIIGMIVQYRITGKGVSMISGKG
jgi:hypothetical protein